MRRLIVALLAIIVAAPAAAQQPQQRRYRNSLPVYSPDGKQIAYTSSGDLYVVNADGTAPRRLTSTPEPEGMPAWTADGRKLLHRSGSIQAAEMRLIDLETGAIETLAGADGLPLALSEAGAVVVSKGQMSRSTLYLRRPG